MTNWLRDEEKELETRKCVFCRENNELEDFEGEDGDICSECSSDRLIVGVQRKWGYGKTKYWDMYADRRTARAELYTFQKGCCAICGISEEDLKKRLSLDHDHETDMIRGLLCDMCNSMLGLARDNPYILRQGAKYLEANGN